MVNWGWLTVWYRNYRSWHTFIVPSLLGNFFEPLLYLFALGYGLGKFVGQMVELPYIVFLATGIVCSTGLTTASFEGMYSAYTRMQIQQTWQSMITAPLSIAQVVLGEAVWAGSKTLFSIAAILIVTAAMGIVSSWQALWVLPIMLVVGTCFGAMALVMTALAKGYDFFRYYFSLFITPVTLLSGVFFPIEGLPKLIQVIVKILPLYHLVVVVRPLMTAQPLTQPLFHLGVIAVYGVVAYGLAVYLCRRRLLD